MKIVHLLAAVPVIASGGCATLPFSSRQTTANILTQVPAAELAACIGQASGSTPVQESGGLVVDAGTRQPGHRYVIGQDKDQTTVLFEDAAGNLVRNDPVAIQCVVKLSPVSAG